MGEVLDKFREAAAAANWLRRQEQALRNHWADKEWVSFVMQWAGELEGTLGRWLRREIEDSAATEWAEELTRFTKDLQRLINDA